MLSQFWTIVRNTFTESIRQPIYAVLILVGGFVVSMIPTFAANTLETGGGDNKFSVAMILSTIVGVGLLLAAFTASGVLSREIDQKTVLTVVSKPVNRPLFVAAKFVGVFAAITLSHLILSLVMVMTIRHGVMSTARDHFDQPVLAFSAVAVFGSVLLAGWGNFYLGWSFTSTLIKAVALLGTLAAALVLLISKEWAFQPPLTEFTKDDGYLVQVCIGLLLLLEIVMILTACAVACSTRLKQVPTVVVCILFCAAGVISNSFSSLVNEQIGILPSTPYAESLSAIFSADIGIHLQLFYLLCKLGYVVLPNFQFLWPADAIAMGHPFSGVYVLSVTGYAALYTVVVLGVAVSLFQTREVG